MRNGQQPKPGEKRSAHFPILSRATSEGEGRARHHITIAANQQSRNPFEELDLTGGNFDNYAKNPVVLWMHDHRQLPIGRSTAVGPDGDVIAAEFEFLPNDPFAARVENAWNEGFIFAASISWIPTVLEYDDKQDILISREWDMIEWSLVTVPADPDALRQSLRALAQAAGQDPAVMERLLPFGSFQEGLETASEEARQATQEATPATIADILRYDTLTVQPLLHELTKRVTSLEERLARGTVQEHVETLTPEEEAELARELGLTVSSLAPKP